ncbi:MAG: YbgC/FadM family acyl-CoA thioesterase [Alphaproteobacteria bacterium]|nr:YbgC/FadM family acyl-CoA thioesterase [Alphaproteobacteria bacterium]
MSRKHEIDVRIYYQDTDAYGIVYHANYLKFAERGRYEYLRSITDSYARFLDDLNIMIVARHIEVDFFAPARLEDLLHLETWVAEMKNSSFIMQTNAYVNGKLINTVRCVLVTVNKNEKPVRVPEELKKFMGA